MAVCGECSFFFPVPEDAGDYDPGKGDCVTEHQDEKGKFWLSKPVMKDQDACTMFKKKS